MWIPVRPTDEPSRRDHTTLYDPRRAEAWALRRWALRASQWRAAALAETVFGAVHEVSLSDGVLDGPLGGLLDLAVPFETIERHRALEAVFIAAAARDPVLSRVPLVYVFSPAVEGEAQGSHGQVARRPARVTR